MRSLVLLLLGTIYLYGADIIVDIEDVDTAKSGSIYVVVPEKLKKSLY